MQIILMEKVVNLGSLGDVVTVKNGYARNYLIPEGKAKRATEAARKEFEVRRAELEAKATEILTVATTRAEKLEGYMVQVTQKAGVDGRVFGSVTNSDIAEALTKQGFEMKKGEVVMPNGPLKTIGDFPITLSLHTDVKAHITVSVLGDHT
ncbi:MAG: 50S ribosomal protein L9 [Usitatibacteraceae bacterium]